MTSEEIGALQATIPGQRRGLVVLTFATVACGLFTFGLLLGGAVSRDIALLGLFAFCSFGLAIATIQQRSSIRNAQAVLVRNKKIIYRTQIERMAFSGGTTNPHYNITLQDLGTLRYLPVQGLNFPPVASLKAGVHLEVHLAGDPPLFFRVELISSLTRASGHRGPSGSVSRYRRPLDA